MTSFPVTHRRTPEDTISTTERFQPEEQQEKRDKNVRHSLECTISNLLLAILYLPSIKCSFVDYKTVFIKEYSQ